MTEIGAKVFKTELAFVYVDLGDNFYKMATHEMILSARRVMPDVKITQISDLRTPAHPMIDGKVEADAKVTKDNITAFKGIMLARHALEAQGPLILCDVDIVWQKNPIELLDSRGVTLMHREGFPSMPFNTGLMLSDGGYRAKTFWQEYLEVITDLDAHGMGTWYCDQIAAAITYDGRNADFVEMDEVLPAPDAEPSIALAGYGVHFKGKRKKWLSDYAGLVA